MSQRSSYLLQIIEKIGAPLLSSIDSVSAQTPDESGANAPDKTLADAKTMAGLLSSSIKLSIELGKTTDLDKAPGETGEALRVALAAISGSLVAGQYKQTRKTPADQDISRIISVMDALVSFSANFTPSEEAAARLQNLEALGQQSDSHQINVQIMQAFIPVLSAVHAFPFGQQEKKLVQEISTKLLSKAQDIRESYFDEITDEDRQKSIELGLIKALAEIYTACHYAEMNRMSAGQQPKGDTPPGIAKVWADFEIRTEMLHTLGASILGGAGKTAGNGGNNTPSPAQEKADSVDTPISATPAQNAPIDAGQQQASITPPASQSAPAAAPQSGAQTTGAGPMGFFAKKPDEDAAPAAPQESKASDASITPPATQDTPPTKGVPESNEGANTPNEPEGNADTQKSGDNQGSGNGGASSNPMGFFAKKDNSGE